MFDDMLVLFLALLAILIVIRMLPKDRLYDYGRRKREDKITKAASKRTPVEVTVDVGVGGRGYWSIYVNGVAIDWKPSFFAARSEAFEIRDYLQAKGFQVEEISRAV